MCSRKPLKQKAIIDLQTMRLLPHSLPFLSNDRYDSRLAKHKRRPAAPNTCDLKCSTWNWVRACPPRICISAIKILLMQSVII